MSRIEDYALIGDCHTAALVGRDGSIDWLCLPRFDSGACFAALLGTEQHGRWLIAPEAEVRRVRRRYRPGTLVLETEYETDDGAVTLIDCMPPRTEEPDLVRVVVGKRGRVRMRMQLVIRFDYGSIVPWVRRTDGSLQAIAGPDMLRLRHAGRDPRREPDDRRGVRRRRRRARAVRPDCGIRRTSSRRRRSTPTRRSASPRSGGRSGPAAARTTGRGARRCCAR